MASLIYNIDSKTFKEYVKNSETFTEILRKCGLENKGGNINTVKRRIHKENIDCSHIKKGVYHNLGKIYLDQRISKEEALKNIFIKNSKTYRATVKILIKRYNLIEYKCNCCGLDNVWNNKYISLQLDHINGINNDNRLENLRYLCPNCHSQTENFAGKCHKKHFFCKKCNSEISSQGNQCIKCFSIQRRKVERPSKEVLENEVLKLPIEKIGERYKVSGNTIRKWCKFYSIKIPYGRGYWQKKPLINFKMTNKEKADNVLASFIQKIQGINTNQKIPKIVKEIDKLSYQCYEDLYGIIDIRKSVSNIDNTKHGHCC